MELNIFKSNLKKALIERGIEEEVAERHVSNLLRSFSATDLNEIQAIQSQKEILHLADSIAAILKKAPASPAESPAPAAPAPQPTTNPMEQTLISPVAYPKAQVPKKSPPTNPVHTPTPSKHDEFFSEADQEPTSRGLTVFWVGLIVTLPLTLGLLAVLFGSFAALFIGLIASILLGIAALVAVAGVGSCLSLVGIIYGITQMFSFISAGIYEIGLGIMIAGVALFLSVTIYNISIRLLPWLIVLVGRLFRFVCIKLKILFNFVRRECYKL